jgi:hypothetical protein
MKWFKHDSDASSDAKIKKLVIRHGAIGYAVYFHCLELIAGNVSNDNITFELEHDSEIIADNLRIKGTAEKSGVQVVEEIMHYIVQLELFENHDGRITCFKMIKRLDSSMTGNPAFRKLIADAKNSHDLIGESHDTVMMRHDSVMLEENRIEKNRKEENINTCSELPKKNGSIEADKPVYCTIITNTGWEYPITTDLVELWKTTFPAVNIEQQLLSMKSWSVTHPKNRKTKGGMLAFVNNWLSKEQNRAGDTRSKQVKRFATETGSLQTSPNDYNSL